MGILSRITGPDPEDDFLQQVSWEETRTDAAIAAASQQHEHQLETRFADDVRLKELT